MATSGCLRFDRGGPQCILLVDYAKKTEERRKKQPRLLITATSDTEESTLIRSIFVGAQEFIAQHMEAGLLSTSSLWTPTQASADVLASFFAIIQNVSPYKHVEMRTIKRSPFQLFYIEIRI